MFNFYCIFVCFYLYVILWKGFCWNFGLLYVLFYVVIILSVQLSFLLSFKIHKSTTNNGFRFKWRKNKLIRWNVEKQISAIAIFMKWKKKCLQLLKQHFANIFLKTACPFFSFISCLFTKHFSVYFPFTFFFPTHPQTYTEIHQFFQSIK